MPQQGTVIGDILETFKTEGGKALKETGSQLAGSINILEGLNPINSAEVAQKSEQYEAEKKAKLAKVRSGLSVIQESSPQPQEDRRVQQGAQLAEQGKVNQNTGMNNLQGQPLSSSMTPKKKMEPLVVQQKRNNKLHGAG